MGVITLARVYDDAPTGNGPRFLVERLWPRGVRRADLRVTDWLKEVAPSDELRRWFGHDPAKWDELRCRYFAELDARPEAWRPLRDAAATQTSRCSTAPAMPSTTTRSRSGST